MPLGPGSWAERTPADHMPDARAVLLSMLLGRPGFFCCPFFHGRMSSTSLIFLNLIGCCPMGQEEGTGQEAEPPFYWLSLLAHEGSSRVVSLPYL